MNSWDDLSIREKAEMMKVAIKNGIISLPDIKDAYNEFAEGGNLFKKGGPKKTSVNPSAQRAMRYFMDKGLTDYQAAGLVGNLMRESGMNPEAVNSSSKAYGLAQWLGSRKKALFAKYGNHPTLDNQLDFIWSELNSTHRNGLKHIKASKSAEEAARNAMGYYEFSVGPAGAIANMKKYGQDGEGSMAKGITFASRLMDQPVPTSYSSSDFPQLTVAETVPQGDFSFTPMNPQVFGMQMPSYQSPVVVPEQPIIVMAEQPTPTPEQLERQRIMQERAEQRDALNRFSLLMSMSNPQQENDMMGAIGMLAGLSNGYRSGGDIHIKPSHRGRFTELKERTGHSASWFKEHGTPAQKKMAIFALNAAKWKHGYGGNLYDGISQPSQQMNNSYTYYKPLENIFVDSEGNLRDPEVPRARGSVLLPEVTISHPDLKDMAGRYSIVSNDAITVVNGRPVNMHLRKAVDEGAKKQAAWAQEHPYLNMIGVAAGATPLAIAATPAVVGGGELAATALANPYIDAGITSAFAGHGLNHAINEGIDGWGDAAMTALEVMPLGRLAKPVWNTGIDAAASGRRFMLDVGDRYQGMKDAAAYRDANGIKDARAIANTKWLESHEKPAGINKMGVNNDGSFGIYYPDNSEAGHWYSPVIEKGGEMTLTTHLGGDFPGKYSKDVLPMSKSEIAATIKYLRGVPEHTYFGEVGKTKNYAEQYFNENPSRIKAFKDAIHGKKEINEPYWNEEEHITDFMNEADPIEQAYYRHQYEANEPLSIDSYKLILQEAAKNNGKFALRYDSSPMGMFNPQGVYEEEFYNSLQSLTPKEQVKAINDWMRSYYPKARPAYLKKGEVMIPRPLLMLRNSK